MSSSTKSPFYLSLLTSKYQKQNVSIKIIFIVFSALVLKLLHSKYYLQQYIYSINSNRMNNYLPISQALEAEYQYYV